MHDCFRFLIFTNVLDPAGLIGPVSPFDPDQARTKIVFYADTNWVVSADRFSLPCREVGEHFCSSADLAK
jgi:hypothetical protein